MLGTALFGSRPMVSGVVAIVFAAAFGCSAGSDPHPGGGGSGGSGSGAGHSGGQGFGGEGFGGSVGGGSNGGVPQTCEEALQQQSYIGCEYWPTISSNSGLFQGFEFAIVAANPTHSQATVTVSRGGQQVATADVAPNELATIKLPWVDALKEQDPNFDGSGVVSVTAVDGAYQVTSTVPVTLYQFNPLEFQLIPAPGDCPDNLGTGECFSYTNDASILLPTSALRDDYYVLSAPTLHGDVGLFTPQWINLPGSMTITATADNTHVTITSSAYTKPGNGVGALTPGGQGQLTLNAGDVVTIVSADPPAQDTPQNGKPCGYDDSQQVWLCPTAPEYDLTGTRVTADQPINVIGGHDCTFMPYNAFACDHLEESMFPVATLGQDLLVTAPQAVSAIDSNPGQPDNMFVRVLSAADNNSITFDPAVHAPVTLNKGQWIEIGPVTQDFLVHGTDKITVGQYMVGENFSGASVGAGDPSLSVAIPKEQYRVSYTFLAPVTYTYNFVNIIAPPGATVMIDGAAVPDSEFTAIGSTGFGVARHKITGGAHSMTATKNFGIVVYGYGSYTSYMYPGGLNLEDVIIIPQ
ncbi:MAG: IgGFc-binding protein [Polyangiaceae bacterium]